MLIALITICQAMRTVDVYHFCAINLGMYMISRHMSSDGNSLLYAMYDTAYGCLATHQRRRKLEKRKHFFVCDEKRNFNCPTTRYVSIIN